VVYTSKHAKHVDVPLNDACRLLTGNLNATPLHKLYFLAGIAPPPIRRDVSADVKRTRQTNEPRHPMFHPLAPAARLKSRQSFLRVTATLVCSPDQERISRWRGQCDSDVGDVTPSVAETLPPGGSLRLWGVEGHEFPEVGSWSLCGGHGALGLRWM